MWNVLQRSMTTCLKICGMGVVGNAKRGTSAMLRRILDWIFEKLDGFAEP